MIDRAREIRGLPGFDVERLWLTFHLCSAPTELSLLARRLSALGAVNLDDVSGGFLYPKLPVANEPSAIGARVEQVLGYAAVSGVHVLSVDLDTASEVGSSTFVELARFKPDGS